jgi:hypothetical protein
MARRLNVGLISLLVFTSAAWADPPQSMPPSNPIVIDTEVGSTASVVGKVTITLEIQIDKSGMTQKIELYEETAESGSLSSNLIDVAMPDADAVAAKIDTASDTASAGKAMDDKAGGVAIGATDFHRQQVVTIADATSASGDSIYISPDNAGVVTKMIHRAQKISEWLQPRVKDLVTAVAQKS